MTGALREGGHVDAARCARRLGYLPAEGRLLERSPARPQMEPTLLVPTAQRAVLGCSSPGELTHTAHHARASQGGRYGDFFIAACSFTRNYLAWSPGGRGGVKLRGKVGVRLLNMVSLSSFDL